MSGKLSSEKIVKYVGNMEVKLIPLDSLSAECSKIGITNPVVKLVITEKKDKPSKKEEAPPVEELGEKPKRKKRVAKEKVPVIKFD